MMTPTMLPILLVVTLFDVGDLITFSSARAAACISGGNVVTFEYGQFDVSALSHAGPSHHNLAFLKCAAEIPLVNKSAGFCMPLM